MQIGVIVRTLGVLFLLFSTTLVPPAGLSVLYDDGEIGHFSATFAIAFLTGLALWLPVYRKPYRIRNRDGFAIVALMWAAMSLLGSLPFMLGLGVDFASALFESASGYTTTGASVLTGLDTMAPSILFYRQEIQWVGGIGVIVLAVALMPMLGIGGMQLYKAEIPGPVKDERLTPRIANTAQTLCVLYVAMTGACALCYWLAGMEAFDAVAHSFTTLSTGGFSTHDASIAFFDSRSIEGLTILFMLLGGISFNVHFLVWRTANPNPYLHDEQVRAFLFTALGLTVVTTVTLSFTAAESSLPEALRDASFTVASVITSTGYGVDDFSVWPSALPVLLIFASFVGGCAGSTAGGMKVVRFVILAKQAGVYVHRLIHPRAVRPIRVDGRVVQGDVIEGIWGFFTIYIVLFGVFMVLLMMTGLDQISAFGAVATTMNNLGPGLGDVATSFAGVSAAAKMLLVAAMLFGRLEIFTLLVLITPSFWKR